MPTKHHLIIIKQPLSDSVKTKLMRCFSMFNMAYFCDGVGFVFTNCIDQLIEFLSFNDITEYEYPTGCMFILSNKHQNLKEVLPTCLPIVYGNKLTRYFVSGFDGESLKFLLKCKYPDFNPESLTEIKHGRY